MANSGPSVLEGVRILELARWQAAPRGGLVLRDMGAEVIKVEWSKGGDLRNSGPFVGDMSVQFAAYNRGKKSISLNTRHQKGKEIFLDMVKLADVVLVAEAYLLPSTVVEKITIVQHWARVDGAWVLKESSRDLLPGVSSKHR